MSGSSGVADIGLRDAHESQRLVAYLSDVWDRRSFIWYVAANELRSRQITTVLGNLWHLLNPALAITVYYIIFGLLLKTTRGVDNFILFLTVGIFIYQHTQRSTIAGAKSIISNVGLLRAVKFPRAVLPITSSVTETLATLPSLVVVYAVALFTGQEFRWQWVLLPALLGVQFVFNVGAAMLAARATSMVPDTTQILPFVFRLLFYASGVIFNAESYATGDNSWLFTVNPLYCFLTIGRWCVIGGDLDNSLLLSAAIWTVSIVVVGFLWFRAAEDRYTRD